MPSRAEPALLLLPGMMCDERLFAPVLDVLDVPRGRPLFAGLDGHDSIEALATAALRRAGPGPLVPVGLSMGGIVAMECLRQAPGRIDALVLMDTNPFAETPERRALRVPQIGRALAGELDAVLIEEMKPLYLAPANRDDEALLSLVLEMARGLGPEVFGAQSRALAARRDYRAILAGYDGPALLLCGEHDTLCPPERHRAMRALMPQAELVVVPGAGHLPTLETPVAVARALAGFLERTAAPRD